MILFIYNFVLLILSPLILVILFFKMGKNEFLSHLKISKELHDSIWIHCASVGEVNAAKPLILKLLNMNETVLVTTMTTTGQATANSISQNLTVELIPFDFFFLTKRAFKKINPKIIILIETEFWPNMLHRAKLNNIPIMIINGRISDKSFPSYQKTRFFWKPLWKAIKAVGAQSVEDEKRFQELGFTNVHNTHNLKFSINLKTFDMKKIQSKFHISDNDFVLVFGSSRPGEEKLIHSVLKEIKIDNLKLIIAPRHLKRISEIQEIFKDEDVSLLSENKDSKILIIDEMGILNQAYSICDIAIVGGSFFNFGGHNPLEPAFYAKPIIMGEYFSSCKSSVEELQKMNAISITENLADTINKIYLNEKLAQKMGTNAKIVLAENSKSLQNNIELIFNTLK